MQLSDNRLARKRMEAFVQLFKIINKKKNSSDQNEFDNMFPNEPSLEA